MPLAPLTPPLPERTVADLIAEVILRGKSERTRRAYRADMVDFFVWLVGGDVLIPLDTNDLRRDTSASRQLNTTLQRLQAVTEGDINAYRQSLATLRVVQIRQADQHTRTATTERTHPSEPQKQHSKG